jgi:hypothetical protein
MDNPVKVRSGKERSDTDIHPDDFRRRLVPYADIFNRKIPIFSPPPKNGKNENEIKNENVGSGSPNSKRKLFPIFKESEVSFIENNTGTLPEYYRPLKWVMVAGVMSVSYNDNNDNGDINDSNDNTKKNDNDIIKNDTLFPVLSFEEFIKDFNYVRQCVFNGPTTSYSFTRLELLSAKFNLHILLNGTRFVFVYIFSL